MLGFFQERLSTADFGSLHGVRLSRLVSLGAKIGGRGATLGEEAGEDGLDKGTEDNLSTTIVSYKSRVPTVRFLRLDLPGLRKSHPQDEDEFEGVVEGFGLLSTRKAILTQGRRLTEPVDSADGTFKYGQECVDDPVLRLSTKRYCSNKVSLEVSLTHSQPLRALSAKSPDQRSTRSKLLTWVSSTLLALNKASRE